MTLGCILIRKKYENDVVQWVRDIRSAVRATQGPSLHYRRLSRAKRVIACQMLSQLPVRAIVLASNKRNMRGYRNDRAAKIPSQEPFYNWCIRLVLERATDLVDRQKRSASGSQPRLKIVMSQKGGHSYSQTQAYIFKLQEQARAGSTVLQKRQIKPDTLHWNLIQPESAHTAAGAQLADVIASAFFNAVSRTSGYFTEPAEALRSIMAKENGQIEDYGVVLQPPPWKAEIDFQQKAIFKYYGHIL